MLFVDILNNNCFQENLDPTPWFSYQFSLLLWRKMFHWFVSKIGNFVKPINTLTPLTVISVSGHPCTVRITVDSNDNWNFINIVNFSLWSPVILMACNIFLRLTERWLSPVIIPLQIQYERLLIYVWYISTYNSCSTGNSLFGTLVLTFLLLWWQPTC